MFHVKHPQGESKEHTCAFFAEPQDVAIANTHKVTKEKNDLIFLFGNRRV